MIRIICSVLLVLLLASCKKQDKLNTGYIPTIKKNEKISTTADSFYFRAVINGEEVNWVVEDYNNGTDQSYQTNAIYGLSQVGGECSDNNCHYFIANTVIFINNVQNIPQISAGFNIATNNGDKSEIRPYFLPGMKIFGMPRSSVSEPVRDGVVIRYIDKNNTEWVSHYGQSIQTGSYFQSTLLTEARNEDSKYEKKWKANFSCRLYDRSGNSS